MQLLVEATSLGVGTQKSGFCPDASQIPGCIHLSVQAVKTELLPHGHCKNIEVQGYRCPRCLGLHVMRTCERGQNQEANCQARAEWKVWHTLLWHCRRPKRTPLPIGTVQEIEAANAFGHTTARTFILIKFKDTGESGVLPFTNSKRLF